MNSTILRASFNARVCLRNRPSNGFRGIRAEPDARSQPYRRARKAQESLESDISEVFDANLDIAADAVSDAADTVEAMIETAGDAVVDASERSERAVSERAPPPAAARRPVPRETPQEWGPPTRGTTPLPNIGDPEEAAVEARPAPDSRFEKVKKVLVAGATGGVGRKVVAQLVAKGVEVVALAREPERARKRLPSEGVTIVKGDVYQYTSLPSALHGCDAVICATGATEVTDPLGPFNTDYSGTVNLIAASQRAGIERFVFVTSIGTDDPIFNPLNLFWGILFWKKRAEEHLQRSGLSYTIVRPGGLVSDGKGAKKGSNGTRGEGNVVMAPAGTYGIPPKKAAGSIKRSKVAECCVEALVAPGAVDKVVEVISERSAPLLGWEDLFEGVKY